MPRRKQTKGLCLFCNELITKGWAAKHFASCRKRLAAIEAAEAAGKQKREKLFHLRVQSRDIPDFWMDMEMRGAAILEDLDAYLRAIWLECCGHLSQFTHVDGFRGEKIGKSRTIAAVFRPGVQLLHVYDFGTPSETLITMAGVREGAPLTPHPIFLMARNVMPLYLCDECDRPATHFCWQCLQEGERGFFCDEHAATHEHEEDGEEGEPQPLVNSPRVGVCGYDGPAEPPY